MFWFIIFLLPFYGHTISIDQFSKYPPSHHYEYEFFDIDEADIPIEMLSVYALPNTLAPMINDKRQIAYNKNEVSILREFTGQEMSPHIGTMSGKIHGLNGFGNILTVFKRSQNDMLWELWLLNGLHRGKKIQIDLNGIEGNNLYLRSLTNGKLAVGTFKPSGALRPVIWSEKDGLHHLGYYLGWDIEGIAWDANYLGTVVGSLSTQNEEGTPFAWNIAWGLERLKSFTHRFQKFTRCKIDGQVIFSDLAIAPNDRIYGTFYIDKDQNQKHHAFWWDPRSDEVRFLNLEGMRINKISGDQTAVGSWNGQAALCDIGSHPILLKDLLPNLDSKWSLLEATAINCFGDIVGYGKYNNSLRYFALKKCKQKKLSPTVSPKEER